MTEKLNFYVPPGGPPQTEVRPNQEIYSKMGEDNIFKMLSDFYKELEGSAIRSLFPDDMQAASRKSAAFFVFILGGPPLYQQKYGPPMMRQRHMPFAIDEAARQEWLKCFYRVLCDADAKYGLPCEHLDSFKNFLDKFSAWMVNTKS